jgi:hypothetical protein
MNFPLYIYMLSLCWKPAPCYTVFDGNFRGRWRANPEIPDSQFIHTNINFLSPIPMHLRIVHYSVYMLYIKQVFTFFK